MDRPARGVNNCFVACMQIRFKRTEELKHKHLKKKRN